ncbi:MAG: CcmD family protein [Bacteroidota bacterium]
MKNSLYFLLFIITTLPGTVMSQSTGNPTKVEMADILHQNGKIYLVVLVLLTIFAGILFMLISMERRILKLENDKR